MPSKSEDKLARLEQKIARQKKREDRTRGQKYRDSGRAVVAICGLAVVHCIFIAVPLFGERWQYAAYHGSTVGTVTMTSGMFVVDIELDCETNFLERGFCKQVKQLDIDGRQLSIYRLKERFCGAGLLPFMRMCGIFTMLQWMNVYLMICLGSSVILHLLSCGWFYFYWFTKPYVSVRRWATFFYAMAPTLQIIGILGWTCTVYSLNDLPKALTAVLSDPTLGVIGFTHVYEIPYGWCWFFCVVHSMTSLLLMLVLICFFRPHESEALCEEEELIKEVMKGAVGLEGVFAEERGSYNRYGAMGVSSRPFCAPELAGFAQFPQSAAGHSVTQGPTQPQPGWEAPQASPFSTGAYREQYGCGGYGGEAPSQYGGSY